jgi:hypothetical protein
LPQTTAGRVPVKVCRSSPGVHGFKLSFPASELGYCASAKTLLRGFHFSLSDQLNIAGDTVKRTILTDRSQ